MNRAICLCLFLCVLVGTRTGFAGAEVRRSAELPLSWTSSDYSRATARIADRVAANTAWNVCSACLESGPSCHDRVLRFCETFTTTGFLRWSSRAS